MAAAFERRLFRRLGAVAFGAAGEDDPAALTRVTLDRLQASRPYRVLATPDGPILYEDPFLDEAWRLEQSASDIGFARAAEGEDLDTRLDHWFPVLLPLIQGRLRRNWDALKDRVPSRDVTLNLPARLAIFGDGGYRGLAQRCVLSMIGASHRKKPFQVVIHLGDTYHGGNEGEMLRHLGAPLSDLRAQLACEIFTLAGNHDLYAGPDGYLGLLSIFDQPGRYFVIEMDGWRVACLDSALEDGSLLRMSGGLDSEQLDWLKDKQTRDPKRLIVLTHHVPRSAWDTPSARLLGQIGELPQLFAWYWGHEHRSVAYDRRDAPRNFAGGCVGHGAFLEKWRLPKSKDEVPAWFPRKGRCTCFGTRGRRYWPHGYLELEVQHDRVVEMWHVEGTAAYVRELIPLPTG